jgi:hypothetical protein
MMNKLLNTKYEQNLCIPFGRYEAHTKPHFLAIIMQCVCVPQMNFWTAEPVNETWYEHHGACAHLNGVLKKPFHQSVCLYVYPTMVARQRLGKNVTAETNTRQ